MIRIPPLLRRPSFLVLLLTTFSSATASGMPQAQFDSLLSEGRLADANKLLTDELKTNPADAEARFALGVVQFLQGVERLGQKLYGFGFKAPPAFGFLLRAPIPLPPNPDPNSITYKGLREILETWAADLAVVESTLAKLTDREVRLPLKLGLVRLDLDGNGTASEQESLWSMYQAVNRNARDISKEQVAEFVIGLDRADAHWLRGYCHLLMALTEFALAHDFRESFERTGHLWFTRVESPHAFLAVRRHPPQEAWGGETYDDLLDLIAAVHLIRWEVAEPQRVITCWP